jgi:hypothetical protein
MLKIHLGSHEKEAKMSNIKVIRGVSKQSHMREWNGAQESQYAFRNET